MTTTDRPYWTKTRFYVSQSMGPVHVPLALYLRTSMAGESISPNEFSHVRILDEYRPGKWRNNPDVDLRALERRWKAGDRDALVEFVRERARRKIRVGAPEAELHRLDPGVLEEAAGTQRYDVSALAETTREVSDFFGTAFSGYTDRDANLLANLLLWFEHRGRREDHSFLDPLEVGAILDLMPYNRGSLDLSLHDLDIRGTDSSIRAVLALADLLTGGHGIEDETVGHDEALASYVNMGDTYAGTLLYDEREERFRFTTAGDWIGENVGWCEACGESFHVDDAATLTPLGYLCDPCASDRASEISR